MASRVSAIFRAWSARCFALRTTTQVALAAPSVTEAHTEQLIVQASELLLASEEIEDDILPEELKSMARDGLAAVQDLELVVKSLPQDHPIHKLLYELSDQMEIFAESVDPKTDELIEAARRDAKLGLSVSLDSFDEPTS